MLLVCNSPDAVDEVLARWRPEPDPVSAARIARLLPRAPGLPWHELAGQGTYQAGRSVARRLAGDLPAPNKA